MVMSRKIFYKGPFYRGDGINISIKRVFRELSCHFCAKK